jgi:hypothetical protein
MLQFLTTAAWMDNGHWRMTVTVTVINLTPPPSIRAIPATLVRFVRVTLAG